MGCKRGLGVSGEKTNLLRPGQKFFYDTPLGGRKKVGTPIRLMAKLLGLRRLRANVTVPFKLEFAKILSSSYFWAARARRAKRAAPSPK